jgi:prepilin-type N-terminal cleavage/methylation domain-containing protein
MLLVFLQPSIQVARRRARASGFTLVELMLVVIIVTVLATLAAPVLISQWREQRQGRQAAIQVANTFTLARSRAMARGAAVMVRWSADSGFTVVEAVEGTGAGACAAQPGLGCLSNAWGDSSKVRTVQTFDTVDAVSITGNNGGTAVTKMNLCFSPLGRSFISFDGTTPTAPMVGTPTLDVRRMDKEGGSFVPAGQTRTVVILPNGMARLGI